MHEWGAFTPVADASGDAVPWASLAGSDDLRCFVEEMWPGYAPTRRFTARVSSAIA